MKNILILLSALLLVAGYAFGEVEVTFDANFTDVDTGMVNKSFRGVLANLDFGDADMIVQDICAHTGSFLFLDEQNTDGKTQFYKTLDNSAYCKIDRATGDIFYRKYDDTKGNTPGLPSKKNAVALARKHLQSLGLLKKEMGAGDVTVTTIEEAFFNGQVTERFKKTRVVTLRRKLAGLPVKGASRVVAMLGTDGDLVGLFVRWMDVTPQKVTGKIAKSKIKRYLKFQIKSRQMEARSVRIKKADLVLFDNGKGVIEPALQVLGEITTENGTFGTDWMFPVLKDPKASY